MSAKYYCSLAMLISPAPSHSHSILPPSSCPSLPHLDRDTRLSDCGEAPPTSSPSTSSSTSPSSPPCLFTSSDSDHNHPDPKSTPEPTMITVHPVPRSSSLIPVVIRRPRTLPTSSRSTVHSSTANYFDLLEAHSKPCHIQKRLSYGDLQCISSEEFEKLDLIGKGTFGVVIKVRHKTDKMIYVMKSHVDEQSRDSVFKELLLHRNLDHPNILRYVGCTCIKNWRLSIISEFIEGGSLSEIISATETRPHFPWLLRCSFAKDIAAGMYYLHENHIAHRDLNPSNCLVRQNNRVVISDFGMAVRLNTDNKWQNDACGNTFHMAPEMMASQPYTELVDVYSFGVIMCELMTRILANPDLLPVHPRTMAMNMELLYALVNPGCPLAFFQLAQTCCDCSPTTRSTAVQCYSTLITILFRLERGESLPIIIQGQDSESSQS